VTINSSYTENIVSDSKKYFAKKNADDRDISYWISKLEQNGYIIDYSGPYGPYRVWSPSKRFIGSLDEGQLVRLAKKL
jgi:hypothetical protein